MATRTSEEPVKYNEVIFFLVLIPFINALNYYLTYTHISFNSHTLITFLIDTFEGYLAWWGLRFVVIYLDREMPYDANPLKRILVQIFLTSGVALLIIIFLTELVNRIAKDTPVPASFYHYDIFIFLIWFFVLNGVYVGLHYYHAMRHIEKLRLEDKKIRSGGFSVNEGRLNFVAAFNTIIGFFVDGDYTAMVTTESKKYLLGKSLDNIDRYLPEELFFRLNRQYIVHRGAIRGFTKIENGKLNVFLSPSSYFPEQVQVSRTKAPDFKNWFKTG
jgi:DNA-binding LytR/AlgR family response regulator